VPSDAERAASLLTYCNYQKVADALRVSRASVADWAKGRSVTPYRLRQLEQLLRPDLEIEEAAPPEWAERLANKTVERVLSALPTPERLRRMEMLIDRLEELAQLPVEASGDPDGGLDQGARVPPGQAVE
jgi:transcriptional regulator with XRE-family HTH domain